jgi:rRNA pseudouridine-1189 N-methylase Emg1 (Nep1/Mra1 family)
MRRLAAASVVHLALMLVLLSNLYHAAAVKVYIYIDK